MVENNDKFVSLITPFDDSTFLCYTRGQFDCWRVSFMDKDGKITDSPRDTYFFDYYLSLTKYGVSTEEIFAELKKLSNRIHKESPVEFDYLKKDIYKAAEHLRIPKELQLQFEKATMSLLAAMLSEEKKAFTKLGKKLKLLGLYQVLIGKMLPEKAASWSRGKPWREIESEYIRLGV